ncbi:uncharacterized protein LOC123532438 [Mercenaria mercenaria]|uniref:uncharacterized protein LOC123532438 n=1 Tax=Mercenaria mercenaria TaxID=6596 RepID=UPI00234F0404|nr:uncharacterized protein LOC123532438 [Mercenaria mercenaria]
MAARRGIGVTRKQVLMRTSVLCKRLRIGSGYPNFVAGKDWWEGVRRRHPDLTIRKPEKLSSTRARMMNREVIGRYFNDLGTIIEELNLLDKPQNVWNCDEMGKSFEHDPVRVVSQKGVNCVTRTSSRSTNITVMACVNANGKRLPPMFVVKGKSSKSLHGFNTENAPAGSRWFYQKNGWMDDQIGEHWFLDVFLKCCGPDRPQLLILDGHSSHETLAFLQCAMENIHLLALPPHTTHYLQPLDRAVFGPLNREYNKACSSFLQENALHQINKGTFPSLFKVAWDSAVVQANIKSGFRACGIFPFNRNAIPDSAFAPSEPTNVPIPEAEVNLHDSLKGGSILAVADGLVNQTGKNEGSHDEVTSSITEKPRTHVVEGLPDTGIFEPVVLQDSSYSLTGSVLDITQQTIDVGLTLVRRRNPTLDRRWFLVVYENCLDVRIRRQSNVRYRRISNQFPT